MLVYNSFEDFTNEEFNANSIKAPTKENEETYTITVNLIYDKEEIEKVYSGIAFSNLIENLRYSSNRTPDLTPDKIEYTVPAGNYDIEVKLRTINMDVIILTATEVNVNNDLELTLDTADADVEINWNALMPDGKVPCNDTPVYDPETFELLEVIPGNVWMQHNDLIVYNEKHEYDDIMSFNPETLIIGDVNLVIGQGNIKTMPNNNYTF